MCSREGKNAPVTTLTALVLYKGVFLDSSGGLVRSGSAIAFTKEGAGAQGSRTSAAPAAPTSRRLVSDPAPFTHFLWQPGTRAHLCG